MPASDATAVRFSPVENVFCGTFELNVEATLVLRTLQSHRLPHGFKGARISRVPATVRSMQRRTSRHTLHGSTHVASSRFRQPYRWSECLAAAVLPRVVARGRRITPTLYRDDIYNMLSSHKTVQRADCRKLPVDSGRFGTTAIMFSSLVLACLSPVGPSFPDDAFPDKLNPSSLKLKTVPKSIHSESVHSHKFYYTSKTTPKF